MSQRIFCINLRGSALNGISRFVLASGLVLAIVAAVSAVTQAETIQAIVNPMFDNNTTTKVLPYQGSNGYLNGVGDTSYALASDWTNPDGAASTLRGYRALGLHTPSQDFGNIGFTHNWLKISPTADTHITGLLNYDSSATQAIT